MADEVLKPTPEPAPPTSPNCADQPRKTEPVEKEGFGNTREEAVDSLYDAIASMLNKERTVQGIACKNGRCQAGGCWMAVELSEADIRFCKVFHPEDGMLWRCTYTGPATHFCVCVSVPG